MLKFCQFPAKSPMGIDFNEISPIIIKIIF